MCKWAATDDDFLVLRRFSQVSTRLLLRMQDSTTELENELAKLGEDYSREGKDNGTFRHDIPVRDNLLNQLTWRIEQYRRPSQLISSFYSKAIDNSRRGISIAILGAEG